MKEDAWFESVGGTLFFSAGDLAHDLELWMSDGSPEGTILVKDIHSRGHDSELAAFTVTNGKLVFSANDGEHGAEIWTSDGTANGTLLLKDVEPGYEGSQPGHFTVSGGGFASRASGRSTGHAKKDGRKGSSRGTRCERDGQMVEERIPGCGLSLLDGHGDQRTELPRVQIGLGADGSPYTGLRRSGGDVEWWAPRSDGNRGGG